MTSSNPALTMKEFLEAGVHFGHQTRRWNPKMARYIFGERNGIYIIDLKKTMKLFNDACKVVRERVGAGEEVLFVGTKKQAQETIRDEATRCGMPYVNNRWLGGILTNFATVSKGIRRLLELEKMEQDGSLQLRTKKEAAQLMKEKVRLLKNLGGVKSMQRLPGLVFIVDPEGMIKEEILKQEAEKQGIEKDPAVQKQIEQAKEQIIVRALVNQEVIEKVKSADDKELKAYYDANKTQFPSPEQVHARHILVKTKAEADAIKVQLDKGADFTQLAKEKSVDKASGSRGGDLGFFGKGDMIPEFEKAAFSLAVGKISSPIKSQFGYHIIKVEEKKPAVTMSFEEAKPYAEQRVINQKQRERLDSWLAALEKNAKVTSKPELVGISTTTAPKLIAPVAPIAPKAPEKK